MILKTLLRAAVKLAFVAAIAASPLVSRAQVCNPTIPNFHRINGQSATMVLAWSPLPGAMNPTYEIVQQAKSDYCSTVLGPEVVVGTATQTSFTYTIAQPNIVAVVFVRLASDHCQVSDVVVGDSFTTPPSRPPAPAVSSSGVITISYSDSRTPFVRLQRSPTGTNTFQTVATVNPCGADPKTATDTTVTPGVYQYNAFVTNAGGVGVSNTVTVLIGSGLPLKIDSFTATPSTLLDGQPTSIATLAWQTEGATSVSIDPPTPAGSNLPVSGSVPVKPHIDTTYTLTATQGSNSVTAQVSVHVLSTAFINITKLLDPIVQVANTGAGSTTYGLTNSGGQSTTVTLTQQGTVISQSPSTFSLDPGATQIVTVTSTPQPPGTVLVPITISYLASTAAPGPNTINFKFGVFSTNPPPGPVTADASQVRVDVTGAPGTNPTGTVTFTNNGTATLTGILSADVQWITPQAGAVTIAPKTAGTFTFTIDRSQRPDSSSPEGSVEGHLKLTFLKPSGGSGFAVKPLDNTTTIPSVSIVKIVDTVQNTVTAAGVPALSPGEIALFVPGVGHTTSASGTTFVSDVSMLNPQGASPINDVKMYYTPVSSSPPQSKSTSLPAIAGQTSIAIADVVSTIFSGSNDLGTLHIRSKDADKLAVAASVLSTNNTSGTLGNAIPILRSDRSAAANAAVVLTGVRKDATSHTDLYIQETSGAPANVQIDFLAADGSTVSSMPSQAFDPFRTKQLKDAVPQNAVTAVITNVSGSAGQIAAYATATDDASGDTWTISDWSTQLGYGASDVMLIPIAGSVHGANSTFYRSEVAIANRGTSTASGTLTFMGRDGTRLDSSVSLGSRASQVTSDVIGTLFGIASDTTGYLMFTPSSGNFAVTSRTFATVGTSTKLVSSGVPVIAAASALALGGTRQIAGLSDSERSTVLDARAGTFRTNFAMMETTGQPVTVRVTFHFTFPAGAKVSGVGAASRDYTLNGNQFMFLNSIAGEILGAARLQFGDLQNVEADFQVLSGTGAVAFFTSTIDNASSDAIVRTQ